MDKKQELFVSQIQRFSLHDGPGIRTTIFLKGCNLRCKWCHNPETQNLIPEIQYLENRCRKCASCAMTCPQKALTIKPEGWSLDKEHCNNCMICVSNCYANALQISGSYEASEELVAQAKRDQQRRNKNSTRQLIQREMYHGIFLKELFLILICFYLI